MVKYSFKTSQRDRKLARVIHKVKTFHVNRQNTILLLVSIVFAGILLESEAFNSVVKVLGEFGYLSALVLGFLFSFGFTTAPAAATLYLLADHINPLLMAMVASFGAMIGNFLIYNFVKHEFMDEIRYIFSQDLKLEISKFEITITRKMMKSMTFRTVFPALSGILVALPLPTEMFVSILWNMAKYDPRKVFVLSYVFSFIGILALGLFGTGL